MKTIPTVEDVKVWQTIREILNGETPVEETDKAMLHQIFLTFARNKASRDTMLIVAIDRTLNAEQAYDMAVNPRSEANVERTVDVLKGAFYRGDINRVRAATAIQLNMRLLDCCGNDTVAAANLIVLCAYLSMLVGRSDDAEDFAKKALELDEGNVLAPMVGALNVLRR